MIYNIYIAYDTKGEPLMSHKKTKLEWSSIQIRYNVCGVRYMARLESNESTIEKTSAVLYAFHF